MRALSGRRVVRILLSARGVLKPEGPIDGAPHIAAPTRELIWQTLFAILRARDCLDVVLQTQYIGASLHDGDVIRAALCDISALTRRDHSSQAVPSLDSHCQP